MKRWLCLVSFYDNRDRTYYREGESYPRPDEWKPPKSHQEPPVKKFELLGTFKSAKEMEGKTDTEILRSENLTLRKEMTEMKKIMEKLAKDVGSVKNKKAGAGQTQAAS